MKSDCMKSFAEHFNIELVMLAEGHQPVGATNNHLIWHLATTVSYYHLATTVSYYHLATTVSYYHWSLYNIVHKYICVTCNNITVWTEVYL